ncbi:MAG TPA: HD domain-containing phosphohydrolase [Pyrinomonadaceae bacterium]|jgi:HD-GYP domain-containing protein (c-di-GMP phosphodiesterase class II)|nr:HD domain-containing phosphohydrolase [Pyrinomonadaceae bacterium]
MRIKISLIYFVVFTLLAVGLLPLLLTSWTLSDRSAKELRAVEGRYQTQLVQDKARQIELFGQRYADLVGSYAKALELSNDFSLLSSQQTEEKLGATLKENPYLLALYIKPVGNESLSVFRSEQVKREEIETFATGLTPQVESRKLVFGQPQKIASSGELVQTIASPVIINNNVSAFVMAVVSLREISRIMAETKPTSEEELWKAGLPIIFVVDEKGNAVFHPDVKIVASQKSLLNLKIVQEWQEANQQIQSALVPFTAEYDGEQHEMIGAYSTANFHNELKFGVIAMQDESKALASVGEMRRQTWFICLAFAMFALIVGFLLSRQMTNPLFKLASAAQKIAAGDFATRVDARGISEIGKLGEAFNLMSDNVEEHIAKLAKAAEENRELFVGTVKALAAAIDGKDKYTRGHSERVARISVAIGKRLGMDEVELETLRISALLHDVGKIAIDDSILKKPAALTDEEFAIMKTHPQRGYKIMSQIPAMKDFLPGMYMHHEMVNGQGYPQGLTDAQIPLQAKIVSVADTFDAMTIDRPYSKGMTLKDSLDRIGSFVGTRYDGRVVQALVEACNAGQIGIGIVKLREEARNSDRKLVSAREQLGQQAA